MCERAGPRDVWFVPRFSVDTKVTFGSHLDCVIVQVEKVMMKLTEDPNYKCQIVGSSLYCCPGSHALITRS